MRKDGFTTYLDPYGMELLEDVDAPEGFDDDDPEAEDEPWPIGALVADSCTPPSGSPEVGTCSSGVVAEVSHDSNDSGLPPSGSPEVGLRSSSVAAPKSKNEGDVWVETDTKWIRKHRRWRRGLFTPTGTKGGPPDNGAGLGQRTTLVLQDRKSTRLNSSH